MPATSSATNSSTSKLLAIAIIPIATLHLIAFGYFLFATAIVAPMSDMFDYIVVYLQYRDGTFGLIDYLWLPHAEHRLAWTRLLTLIDVELFHTGGLPFIVAATALLLATAVLVWYQLRRAQNDAGGERRLALLAPMMLLSTANVVDCSVPINSIYPTTLFFIVLALVLFTGGDQSDRYRGYARAGAVVAALAAGLATAAGLLAWPLLLWSAWQARAGGRWMAFLGAAGIACFALYVRDLPVHGLAPALEMDVASFLGPEHLARLAHYFLSFLGLPFSREPALDLVGRLIGAVLLIAGSSAVVCSAFSPRARSPCDQIGIGLILLGLGAAALATLGRADIIEEGKLPVRYTIFMTALHVGLLFLVLPRLVPRSAMPGRRLLVNAGGVGIAVLLLVQQIVVGRGAARIAGPIAAEANCFLQGIRSAQTSHNVAPDPEAAQRVLAALRQNGLLAASSAQCNRD